METLFRRFAEQQVVLTENLNRSQREFHEWRARFEADMAEGQKRLQNEQTRLAQAHIRLEEAHTRLEDAHTRLLEAMARQALAFERLEEVQKITEERLNALILVVDSLVRRFPPAQ